MKKKNPEGTLFILFETDMDNAKPLDVSTLSNVQRAWLESLSDEVRSQILAGQAGIVVNMSDNSTVCEFNMDTYMPPKHAIESLARCLLPEIREYYEKLGKDDSVLPKPKDK